MADVEEIKAVVAEKYKQTRIAMARKSFLKFVEYTHPGVFRTAKHHEIICREIDDWLESFEPYNMMLWMPPRHCKSKLCSVYLPPYLFGRNPDAQIIASSYAADLIRGMSRQAQRVLMSPQYAEVFPDTQISANSKAGETRQVDEYTIMEHQGHYRCGGVMGGIAGYGATYLLMDDMVKDREEAESIRIREKTWDAYKDVFRSRIEKGGRMILLTTRWHTDDLPGLIIKRMEADPEADRWKVICLPAEYEETEHSHPDDIREDGEALWPEEFPTTALNKIKATSGSYTWHSLYQQRPYPPGGAVIKRDWLHVVDHYQVPPGLIWVRAWDLAVTPDEKADATASGLMALTEDGHLYIKDIILARKDWPGVRRLIIETANSEQEIAVGVTTTGMQKGFFDDILKDPEMHNIVMHGHAETKSKLVRAQMWIARAEAGKLHIVNGNNVDAYISELITFTGHEDTHDDMVDFTSMGWLMLGNIWEPEMEIVGQYGF